MGWVSGIVVFLITWWTLLFMVLPFGHTREQDGTPVRANIKKKFLWTTMLTMVVWCGIYFLIDADLISFQSMAEAMMEEDYHS